MIDNQITIDGIIESEWNTADSTDGFFQAQPYFGQEPSKKTVAKLLTTEEALYCLVICYDDSRNIEQKKGKLDDFGGDFVSVMLDTYGDERTAYKFGVTAAGVKSDCRLLDDASSTNCSS